MPSTIISSRNWSLFSFLKKGFLAFAYPKTKSILLHRLKYEKQNKNLRSNVIWFLPVNRFWTTYYPQIPTWSKKREAARVSKTTNSTNSNSPAQSNSKLALFSSFSLPYFNNRIVQRNPKHMKTQLQVSMLRSQKGNWGLSRVFKNPEKNMKLYKE